MTDKQKLFCIEYLKDLNATQAAIRAGYSEDTASIIGFENLRKPNIKEYIGKAVEEVLNESKDEIKYRIIQELKEIAFSDITKDINVVTEEREDEDGNVKRYQTVRINDTEASSQSKAIAGIKITDKGNIEVKYYDKVKPLELLGKYTELFVDKVEHSISSETYETLKELYK